MKRKHVLIGIATLLVALCGMHHAQAQDYGIRINGQAVTSANAGNISASIKGVTGMVQYIQPYNLLILANAQIVAEGNQIGIESDDEGLTIQIEGNCSVTSTGNAAIAINKRGGFSGSGTLTATSQSDYGIVVNNAPLMAITCTIKANGKYGLAGREGSNNATLEINGATIEAEGTNGSLCNFASLVLIDSKIAQPAGAVWNSQKKALCSADGRLLTEKILISPVVYYPLSIAGVQVNDVNCDKLSNLPGVEGTVTYAPTTKTLTLQNAKIAKEDGGTAIISSIEDLKILVEGECSIKSKTTHVAVGLFQSAIISGKGHLSISSEEDSGILLIQNTNVEGATDPWLMIKDCRVDVSGRWGILGHKNTSLATLRIDNATVKAKGYEGSISGLSDFTLKNSVFVSPEGAKWDSAKRAVCDAMGNIITEEVVIESTNPEGLETLSAEASIVAIYSVEGLRREALHEGVNVVVYDNGTTAKLILTAEEVARLNVAY